VGEGFEEEAGPCFGEGTNLSHISCGADEEPMLVNFMKMKHGGWRPVTTDDGQNNCARGYVVGIPMIGKKY